MYMYMCDANGTSLTRPTLVWAWPEARSLHIASMAMDSYIGIYSTSTSIQMYNNVNINTKRVVGCALKPLNG